MVLASPTSCGSAASARGRHGAPTDATVSLQPLVLCGHRSKTHLRGCRQRLFSSFFAQQCMAGSAGSWLRIASAGARTLPRSLVLVHEERATHRCARLVQLTLGLAPSPAPAARPQPLGELLPELFEGAREGAGKSRVVGHNHVLVVVLGSAAGPVVASRQEQAPIEDRKFMVHVVAAPVDP